MRVLAVSFIHTVLRGRYFMQAQVKYESEIKTAVLGDRTITVKNVTPFTRRRSGISEAVRSSGGCLMCL